METMTIVLKSQKARKLIQDLEELDIIEVLNEFSSPKSESKISELKHKIVSPMSEEQIDMQMEKIRNEWQPSI